MKSVSTESIEVPAVLSRQDTNKVSLVPPDFSIKAHAKKKKEPVFEVTLIRARNSRN